MPPSPPSKQGRPLFITGTDTGVGKTTIACALAAAFHQEGLVVCSLKPVETGCADSVEATTDKTVRELFPADAMRVAAAASAPAPASLLCPNRYRLPVSPEAAAAAEGRPVDLAAILAARAIRQRNCDVLLIEGAGGLLVPLAPGQTMANLIALLDVPLLIVARASLGTVNHTLLTIEAARSRGLSIAGVILNRVGATAATTTGNEFAPDDSSNADAIARHGRVTVFGTFPYAPAASFDTLANFAVANLDLKGLLRAF